MGASSATSVDGFDVFDDGFDVFDDAFDDVFDVRAESLSPFI
jgi:hypothetical protein